MILSLGHYIPLQNEDGQQKKIGRSTYNSIAVAEVEVDHQLHFVF